MFDDQSKFVFYLFPIPPLFDFFGRKLGENSQCLLKKLQTTTEFVVAVKVHQYPLAINSQHPTVQHIIYENQTEKKMQG